MEAIIFVGVQGSGKTSFYSQHLLDTYVRISLDMLRTRHREQLLLAACLLGKQPFVIDNTNPVPSDRARYIEAARAVGFRVVAYFFATSLREAIRRNNLRKGKKKIPIPGITSTFPETASANIGGRLRCSLRGDNISREQVCRHNGTHGRKPQPASQDLNG
jgi:predicted kinase